MSNYKSKVKLHDYQRVCADFIKSRKGCMLALAMGLGKSLTTLQALLELNPKHSVLIIAPKNIARSTWIDEINKWGFPLRYKSFIVNEEDKPLSKKQRLELYKSSAKDPPAVYFINRELVVDIIEYFEKNKLKWSFKTLVIDECQSFKNHSSKRFKAIKKIQPLLERTILLTGTPAPNGLMDLWAQIYLIDSGKRLGKNITSYRNTFFNPGLIVNNYPVTWNLKYGADKAIYDKVKDIMISIKTAKLKIPPKINKEHIVYMDDKDMKLYRQMMKDNVLVFGENEITASNAAVLTAKLSQMASGAIYTNTVTKEYKTIHEKKLEQTISIISNATSPVIVAYHFKSDLDMLMKAFKKHKIKAYPFNGSKQMIDDWNNGKIPVLLGQPSSMGHGLNLQKGGHTLIWYTIPWSLEEYLQCNARLHRQGQKNTIIIHHLITHKTIDEKIMRVIKEKNQVQRNLTDAVQINVDTISNKELSSVINELLHDFK